MPVGEMVEFISGDFDSRLQAGYIAICLVAMAIALVPTSRKSADPKKRRKTGDVGLVDTTGRSRLRHHAADVGAKGRAWMEGPGPGAVMHLLVFVGTATAGLIGWRIPAEIERLYGDGAGFGLIFPNVTMPMIGRLAQVVGALAFAIVALRCLRFLVPVFAVLVAIAVLLLATQYVLGLPLGL